MNRLESLSIRRQYAIAAAMGIAVISTTLLVRYIDRRTAIADRMLKSNVGPIVLEPEQMDWTEVVSSGHHLDFRMGRPVPTLVVSFDKEHLLELRKF